MNEAREILNIVVVGHVDHGKSTFIGRLLYDTHSLPQGTIDKVKRISKESGKPFEYAYLLDAFEEEQKQNITIDTTQIQFQTEQRDYVIIDAPGHKEFLKNMISGAADAEAAFLVVDAQEGVQEQSKRHAYLLSLLGIKRSYVLVNKMDLVDYSEEVFRKIEEDMGAYLDALNVHPLGYIPISAAMGENVTERSGKLPWWKGLTALEALDSVEKERGLEHRALRFPIQDVYKFDDRRIIAGRIESGTLSAGDEITIYPEGKTTRVKTVEYWAPRDKKHSVKAGESVGITVTDEFFNKRGELITFSSQKPQISNTFRANLFWMGKDPLVKGKKYKLKLATAESECELDSVLQVMDAATLGGSPKEQIDLNDVAEVILTCKDTLAFDTFADCAVTGRFVLVDGYDVAGGGIIMAKEQAKTLISGTAFRYPGGRVKSGIFDEFLYDYNKLTVVKEEAPTVTYGVGDVLPLEGRSYAYPHYMDILLLKQGKTIQVRGGKIARVGELADYHYNGLPVVNGRGLEIHIGSQADAVRFLEENAAAQERDHSGQDISGFLNQWLCYETYRRIPCISSHEDAESQLPSSK